MSYIKVQGYTHLVRDIHDFTTFQIKIVFRGTNSAYTARLKDFRGIALAV